MKRLLLASCIALLLSSTIAFAAPRNGGHDDRGPSWNQAHDRGDHDRNHDGDRDDHRWDDHRWNDRDRDRRDWSDHHDGRWDDRRYGSHDNGWHRGYYRHAFRHGDRVPVVYLQPRYYVDDYWSYHLAPPPRGYRWIHPVDGRFILIAATTGLIAEVLGY
jgi:Ni/Co efflux regulator RcnB